MNINKIIKRKWRFEYEPETALKAKEKFIATGQWADGHIAYSRIDDNGNIIEDGNENMFLQIRTEIGLIMIRL